MNLEEDLETSNSTISKLKKDLNKLKLDASSSTNTKTSTGNRYSPSTNNIILSEDDGSAGVSSPLNESLGLANISDFNLNQSRVASNSFNRFNDYKDYSNEFLSDMSNIRERLSQWKDWNVDMRPWRSVGMGPVLEL
ncbi:unnamed protein product [[Candida] boidinii]|uniref:Unnamed protein product n=1 Tax=Candida boidinii TaxID=5477 RepID=A0ACB5TM70_CANBO|nr:unnamed protein product [[Candida] boidinii]GME90828.1 unnamed protein product [[Candida] boidinii]